MHTSKPIVTALGQKFYPQMYATTSTFTVANMFKFKRHSKDSVPENAVEKVAQFQIPNLSSTFHHFKTFIFVFFVNLLKKPRTVPTFDFLNVQRTKRIYLKI